MWRKHSLTDDRSCVLLKRLCLFVVGSAGEGLPPGMAAQHAPVSERPGRLVRHVQRDAQLQRSGDQQTGEEEEEESAGVLQEDDPLLPQTHMSICGRVSCSAICVCGGGSC